MKACHTNFYTFHHFRRLLTRPTLISTNTHHSFATPISIILQHLYSPANPQTNEGGMGSNKRTTPRRQLTKATPTKKGSKLVISRRGTPSTSKASSASKASSPTKASPQPPADISSLHALRFYPHDTPWQPHAEPERRKLCPPCWLAQSKVWGLTGPETGTTADCDRLPCKGCKKKGYGVEICTGAIGEDGRDPWVAVNEEIKKQDASIQRTMVHFR
ncbi:hypothetical protein BJ878DRAFT_272113 [Calycina marina]|uniref:Uncharacterized protein n=1 Tax=Calycina marina TaxID=1763456 RepID=A0A9P8CIL0_9HELO|nr:hypothetical protein BJ878DRAFT_272113 [Calycina marina]